mmetsp:Transcript_40596/g.106649  ORF Transcript_40596/g.106649 Transcript_40596/m.106649 type:complete len:187 (-) Transcript_40596:245-805(-)
MLFVSMTSDRSEGRGEDTRNICGSAWGDCVLRLRGYLIFEHQRRAASMLEDPRYGTTLPASKPVFDHWQAAAGALDFKAVGIFLIPDLERARLEVLQRFDSGCGRGICVFPNLAVDLLFPSRPHPESIRDAAAPHFLDTTTSKFVDCSEFHFTIRFPTLRSAKRLCLYFCVIQKEVWSDLDWQRIG